MMEDERKAVTDLLDTMAGVREMAKRHSSDERLMEAVENLFKSGLRAAYQLCRDSDVEPNEVDSRILDTDFYKGTNEEGE